ncbi:hypothetical protein CCR94_05810 [Rhodoblastus sphagnicola]|uniref:Flagellar hook-length control protein-like C-terminal domain-containing protein n=1 Tax=Rhodoblastus sphagnicola TaxID=333368 RepID=A0A2S6NCJ5_9HYPH|nr:flagellar hook-length control protein FliK [Rhodoblastus sphagnicola]MBB4199346.1 flagellar hook-length control protein FliK [Rhodoblastus sphagnicola]PPQ32324.1 hypothetical protein CCR94_05810 [Rhodoblastus sphagnicola]
MTTSLTAAGLTQDAGGALAMSRKGSRNATSDLAAFDATMARSSDDAQPRGDSSADASALATAGGNSAASTGATTNGATPQDSPEKFSALGAGDRLASRMAAAWLDSSATTSSQSSVAQSSVASDAPASTTSQTSFTRDPLAALLAADVGQSGATESPGTTTVSLGQTVSAPSAPPQTSDAAGQGGAVAAPQTAPSTGGATQDAKAPVASDATSGALASSDLAASANLAASIGARWPRPALTSTTADAASSKPSSTTAQADAPTRRPSTTDDASVAEASQPAATQTAPTDLLSVAVQPVVTPPDVAAQVAQTLVASPPVAATPVAGASAASPSRTPSALQEDPVARIGAALSTPASATPDKTPARAAAALPERDADTVSVHVVSQQSWLPPVDANLSGGSQSHQQPGKESETGKPAETQAAGAIAQPSSTANFAAMASSFGVSRAINGSDAAAPASTTASAAASARPDPSSTPTPTLRRDLEITLTPQDLGGLSVKLKSSGDRLELAFVSDRGETARMISDKSTALENQLNNAGLGLGGVAISSSAAGDMSGALAGGGQGGQGAGQNSSQASGASQGNASGQTDGNSESTRQRQNSSERQGQDNSSDPVDHLRDPRPAGDRGLYL